MARKAQDGFTDAHLNIRKEFDDLKSFVNLEMYLPMKKTEHRVESQTEYMK